MKTFKVYLSGPITGLTFGEAVGWTDYAKKQLSLNNTGIVGYKPLRGKEHLTNTGKINAVVKDGNPLTTSKAIVARDSYDVKTCDCMLVNLLGAQTKSVGTISEIAWAWLLGKPIVLVMEEHDNCHEHAFIREMCSHQVTDLDVGVAIVKQILLAD